jgi:hypothetical protein
MLFLRSGTLNMRGRGRRGLPVDSEEEAGLTLSSFSESLMRFLMPPCDGYDFGLRRHACFRKHLQDTAWECFADEDAERGAVGNIIEETPFP